MPLLLGIYCGAEQGTSVKSDEVKNFYKSDIPLTPQRYYTSDNPREWADIADELVPVVKKTRHRGKEAWLIQSSLKKSTAERYVEKIGVLDENGKTLAAMTIERTSSPKTYAYILTEDLPSKDNLRAFIKYNLYDLWVSDLEE